MARGGKREGAGRKAGVPSAKMLARQRLAEVASRQGISPLDVMIANMLHFHKLALDAEKVLEGLKAEDFTGVVLEPAEQFQVLLAEVKKAAGLRQLAQECARDAASYVHPRLAAMTHTHIDKRDATDWTRDELVALLHDAQKGGNGAATANGRGNGADSVH